jgi:hypothetical protein
MTTVWVTSPTAAAEHAIEAVRGLGRAHRDTYEISIAA